MALRVLIVSDLPIPSGFGRISTYIARYLQYRGHDVRGAGLFYNGDPHGHPFHIWPLVGQDIWGRLTQIINQGVGDGWVPDLVISCQDFPYHISLGRDCPIDWSQHKWIFITPIDGMPVFKEWEVVSKLADGRMVISRFGVEAMRRQGVKVDLCHPGVDTNEFYPATQAEKLELRQKAGFPNPNVWMLGMFAMNQGRKAIPDTLKGFMEFARDKDDVVLYLDMDEISPAGWNIPVLAEQIGLSTNKILLRQHLQPRLPNIRDRYALLDAHAVLAYREGFGLPLLESMSCHIPTLAMDWCAGTEIVGEGRGYLIPRLKDAYGELIGQYGTWGNAQDAIPDLKEFVVALNHIYEHPIEANAIAERGYQWATKQTWENCGRQVEDVITRIFGAKGVSHSANLQPNLRANSANPEVYRVPDGDQQPRGDGADNHGRLFSFVEPAGVIPDPSEDQQESPKPGVRRQRKPRGVVGDGVGVADPELGY